MEIKHITGKIHEWRKKIRIKYKLFVFLYLVFLICSQLTSPTAASFSDTEQVDINITLEIEDEIVEDEIMEDNDDPNYYENEQGDNQAPEAEEQEVEQQTDLNEASHPSPHSETPDQSLELSKEDES